jgi:D-alanyl-D-alanine carboxypeptidase (penicillin-binding protein 5/6)
LENPKDYNFSKSITISEDAANQGNTSNYGNLDNYRGEKFTVEQLLDLMLIYSSNDAAWALAEVIGGPNFVKKMNQKADNLGLQNTHFVNPHGLDPKDIDYTPATFKDFNYSTAKDLIKISQYILKEHPLIFEITKKEPIYSNENGIHDLFLPNKNEIIGGKTGYTKNAGGCILFIFKNKQGDVFINVILGTDSEEARIKEMQKLIDWLNT